MDLLWARLEKWQNCQESKTTAETYLKICEQLDQEPDPDRMPPEVADFPDDVQYAMITYGKLGDRLVADVGYLGKDYTSLPIHMKILNIQNEDLFIETLLRLDERIIKTSAETMRREREKLKRK